MKRSSVGLLVAILILTAVSTTLVGCVSQSTANSYYGKTFSVNYPKDWQTFDVYTLSNMPESYRTTIPESILFAPSLQYPTPLVIGVYVYPTSDPFGKQEAEAKFINITQMGGTKFSYLDTITVDGEPAYEYRSYDDYGNAARNILLRKGSYLYFIQGYEDEKNLNLLIQSFKASP